MTCFALKKRIVSSQCSALLVGVAMLLSGLAVKLARDYDAQRAAGKLPKFDASQYPEIRSKLEPGIWD